MFKSNLGSVIVSYVGIISFICIYLCGILMYKKKKKILSAASLYFSKELREKAPNNVLFKFLSNYTFLAIVECIIFTYVQYVLSKSQNIAFSEIFNTGANYFGLIVMAPIYLVAFCLILWISPLKQIDLITPIYPLALVFIKITCFINGCCHGIEWDYGIFNYNYGRPEVPVQLIEAFWALLIFIILMKYRKKAKLGTVYPMFVILYSATRFFSEFLRGEPNVLGILKTYHLLCIAGVVFGVILYIVAIKFSDKITDLFKNTTYFTKGNLHATVVIAREKIIQEN